jgi:hypothetical protein
MSKSKLKRDGRSVEIQAFVPNPNKSIDPVTLAGTYTVSTDVDLADAVAIIFRSSVDITRYFNSDTTKTRTIPALTDTILVIHDDVTEITLSGNATVEIEVM